MKNTPKPELEPVCMPDDSSLTVDHYRMPTFAHPFHYHPEIELTLIIRGAGTRIIGDKVDPFQPGDLCLIGSNLPHLYRRDVTSLEQNADYAESIVIKMRNTSMEAIAEVPEFDAIKRMLSRAQRGLHFSVDVMRTVRKQMEASGALTGPQLWMHCMEILQILASAKSAEIASPGILHHEIRKNQNVIDTVCSYIFDHFEEPIKFENVAAVAKMSPSTFSRFFQRYTGLSFTHFIVRVRLSRACQLMIETDLGIAEICYQSGFGNLSNFNRHFKEQFEVPPRTWRKQHRLIGLE